MNLGGIARPIEGQVFWKEGDGYMGDPGAEGKDLNAVLNQKNQLVKLLSISQKK